MSRPIFFKSNKLNLDLLIQIPIIGFTVLGNAVYSYGTKNETAISIDKTYTYTRNGYTDFMIIDKTGKHYNLNNSFWYWKWDSIEDWNNFYKDEEIYIKYYGYRIPFLGFFPNIYYSKKTINKE